MANLIRITFWLFVAMASGGLLCASAMYLYLAPGLASTEGLCETRLETPLRVYTRDHKLIKVFGEKRRTPIKYDEVPPLFVKAILAAEDDRFEHHSGIDIAGLVRAAVQLVTTGQIQSGGSTITMQVAKNCLLSSEKTFTRKFNEILLALNIERVRSKSEILELYFNVIFLGKRAHGIQAAAERYYGNTIDQLSLPQLAMIAGLPKAPSLYNPIVNPARAKVRRNWILLRMQKLGFIDQAAYEEARSAEITASVHDFEEPEAEAGYVAEMARNWMFQHYGEDAYTSGFSVRTTIDSQMQDLANQAVRHGLLGYDRRHGYRGPEETTQLPQDPTPEKLRSMLRDKQALGGLATGIVIESNPKSARVGTSEGEIELDLESVKWAKPYIDENRVGPAPRRVDDVLKPGEIIRIARSSKGKWELGQLPHAQGALTVLDPETGAVHALVGGFHFNQSKFNRAVQARRQPGSTIKPFIYMAALENGITAASIFNDAPVVERFSANTDNTYVLNNANGINLGPTRLRQGLFNSVNTISARVLKAVGIPATIEYLDKIGFETRDMPRNLQLAVGGGTIRMTPLEVAARYASLSNGGHQIHPWFIESVTDHLGRQILRTTPYVTCDPCEEPDKPAISDDEVPVAIAQEEEPPVEAVPVAVETLLANQGPTELGRFGDEIPATLPAPKVMEPGAVYIMNSILRDVVQYGTARRARKLGRSDIGGKTGTTDDARNLWFSGFNQDLVATAWVGFDEEKPLGRREFGSTAALPIWIKFMEAALDGRPERIMKQPDNVVSVKIDPETGLLAAPGQRDAIFEIFTNETVPTEMTRRITPLPGGDEESEGAFTPEQLF